MEDFSHEKTNDYRAPLAKRRAEIGLTARRPFTVTGQAEPV